MNDPYVLAFVGENANDILLWWTEKILQNMARFKLAYKLIDLRKPNSEQLIITSIQRQKPVFCFSFQGMGMNAKINGNQNLWAANNIPFLTYLGDSPYHAPHLHEAEGTGLYLLYSCLDFFDVYKTGMRGKTFASLIRYNYPMPPQHLNPDWKQRPIKMLFAKSFTSHENIRKEFDTFPRLLREIAHESADLALKEAEQTIFQICNQIFEAHNVYSGVHNEILFYICSKVDLYVRAVHAERMIKAVLPHEAVIVGDWGHLSLPSSKARIMTSMPANQLNALYRQSKVVVNTLPSVRYGIHERVMAGLLSKSVVISDTTPFLESLLSECPTFAGLNIDSHDFSDHFDQSYSAIFSEPDILAKLEHSAAKAHDLFSLDTFVDSLMEYISIECKRRNIAEGWGMPRH